MNRATRVTITVPAVVATLTLSACGGTSSSSGGATAATTSTTAGATTATGGTSTVAATTASQCPTSNTRAFAKTRFVTDVGLAAGTFHHSIYKPYQAGSFAKGAKGRTRALITAAGVALIDAKLVDNAYKNVQASPALCKALVEPLGKLDTALGGLKGQLLTGNVGSLATIDGLVKDVEGTSASNGAAITENDSVSAAQSASSGS